MKPEAVRDIIGNLPFMSLEQAKYLEIFINDNKIKDILELGFAHGVSTCYLAGILDEKKSGSILTIDLQIAKNRSPNITELLDKAKLSNYVNVFFEPSSYTWRLMKLIEENKEPIFDFCYIDGGHIWDLSGFAFFLVDKLLKKGGWILFDDLTWSFSKSESLRNKDKVKAMPQEERETEQVSKVFELLVKQHPSYTNFYIWDNNWGFAQKKP